MTLTLSRIVPLYSKRLSAPTHSDSPCLMTSMDIPSSSDAAMADRELYTLCSPNTLRVISVTSLPSTTSVYVGCPRSSNLILCAEYLFCAPFPNVTTRHSRSFYNGVVVLHISIYYNESFFLESWWQIRGMNLQSRQYP